MRNENTDAIMTDLMRRGVEEGFCDILRLAYFAVESHVKDDDDEVTDYNITRLARSMKDFHEYIRTFGPTLVSVNIDRYNLKEDIEFDVDAVKTADINVGRERIVNFKAADLESGTVAYLNSTQQMLEEKFEKLQKVLIAYDTVASIYIDNDDIIYEIDLFLRALHALNFVFDGFYCLYINCDTDGINDPTYTLSIGS